MTGSTGSKLGDCRWMLGSPPSLPRSGTALGPRILRIPDSVRSCRPRDPREDEHDQSRAHGDIRTPAPSSPPDVAFGASRAMIPVSSHSNVTMARPRTGTDLMHPDGMP